MTEKTLSDDLADAIVDNFIADYEGRLSELACRDIAKRAYALGAGGAYTLSNGLTQAKTDATASVAGLSTKAYQAQPAPAVEVRDMALCERHRLVLRIGQPYRFFAIPGCATCAEMKAQSDASYGADIAERQQPAPAVEERASFEAWMRRSVGGDRWDVAWQAWQERAAMVAQPAQAVEADAARYRFIRDDETGAAEDIVENYLGKFWDKEIDAAIAAIAERTKGTT